MISFVHPTFKTPLIRKDNSWFDRKSGHYFDDKNGLYCFYSSSHESEKDRATQAFYDERASVYDQNLPMTFFTHNENEQEVREKMIHRLQLNSDFKVLEIGCGTGRDSEIIANYLSVNGALALLDLSEEMLQICKSKLSNVEPDTSFCLSSAEHLPFPDHYFDAIYSFGGIGEFHDIKKALQEMVRVTKIGGKIVFGDESMPEWLRGTYFSNVLTKTNPQFSAELPLKYIPVEARNVNLSYVIGGVFYVIDFEVGEGEPTGNFDFPIPGLRGGTLRTRYEGQLEGVTKETKEKLIEYCKTNGISIHDFLETLIKGKLED